MDAILHVLTWGYRDGGALAIALNTGALLGIASGALTATLAVGIAVKDAAGLMRRRPHTGG